VHLSRPRTEARYAADAHNFLHEDDWKYFETVRHRLPALLYVSIEYYRDGLVLLDQIRKLIDESNDTVILREYWDSDFFDVSIGSVVPEHLTDERATYAVSLATESGIQCLYFFCDAWDKESRNVAIRHGFNLVGRRVTYEADVFANAEERSVVDCAKRRDIAALQRISSMIFRGTRFYVDEQFPDEQCDSLYAKWISNAVNGYADVVMVARDKNQDPVGFVTCKDEGEVGEVGLLGVAPSAQGEGIGTDLMYSALAWSKEKNHDRLTVKTQSNNYKARRLYESCGFSLTDEQVAFHWWDE
jgi:RimJ/RimL family protein N-acetyltransferase